MSGLEKMRYKRLGEEAVAVPSGTFRPRVLVTGKVAPVGLARLAEFAEVSVLVTPTEESLSAAIADTHALLHKVGPVSASVLQNATNLRMVARHGVGLDDLDLPYLHQMKVVVTTTAAANSQAVAEHTLLLALTAARKLIPAHMSLGAGTWRREEFMGSSLSGSTFGLIGMGRIGQGVARLARAFGCTVLGYDKAGPFFADLTEAKPVTLENLLRRSDFVSLHCPLTAETQGLIGKPELSLMKSGAVLINTARGGLVDEAALTEALVSGALAGAALDVYAHEPPDFASQLLHLPNVVHTPHIAAMTAATQEQMALMTADSIQIFLMEGRLPPHVVDAAVYCERSRLEAKGPPPHGTA